MINAEIRSIQLIAVFLDPHRNRHADLRNLAVITGKSNTGNHFILQLTKADILNILIAADYLRGDFYIHILFCKSLIKEICPCILRLCKGDIQMLFRKDAVHPLPYQILTLICGNHAAQGCGIHPPNLFYFYRILHKRILRIEQLLRPFQSDQCIRNPLPFLFQLLHAYLKIPLNLLRTVILRHDFLHHGDTEAGFS